MTDYIISFIMNNNFYILLVLFSLGLLSIVNDKIRKLSLHVVFLSTIILFILIINKFILNNQLLHDTLFHIVTILCYSFSIVEVLIILHLNMLKLLYTSGIILIANDLMLKGIAKQLFVFYTVTIKNLFNNYNFLAMEFKKEIITYTYTKLNTKFNNPSFTLALRV